MACRTLSAAALWSLLDLGSQLSLSKPEKSGLSPNDALGNSLKHLLHPEKYTHVYYFKNVCKNVCIGTSTIAGFHMTLTKFQTLELLILLRFYFHDE